MAYRFYQVWSSRYEVWVEPSHNLTLLWGFSLIHISVPSFAHPTANDAIRTHGGGRGGGGGKGPDQRGKYSLTSQ